MLLCVYQVLPFTLPVAFGLNVELLRGTSELKHPIGGQRRAVDGNRLAAFNRVDRERGRTPNDHLRRWPNGGGTFTEPQRIRFEADFLTILRAWSW